MQNIGEKLREARLEKKLSLDKVYKQTKIHPTVLEALEQDRAHNFLGFVYIKGLLKTYARFLGLDEQMLLKEYIDSQEAEVPAPEIILERQNKGSSRINPLLILRIGIAIFLVFALVFYFRYVAKTILLAESKGQIQKVKVKVVPAEVVKTENLVLEVRTKQDCWLRVKSDNQTIFEKTLPKGKRERWLARERIELRIGKPEALEIFFNGKPIDLEKEQVKKGLVITRQGIEGR